MENLTVWHNARLDLQFVVEEDDVESITIALQDSDDNNYEFTQPVVDNVADFQSEDGIPSLPVGEYTYMVYENYDEGLPAAYPDPDNCDGECDLPTITICEAVEVS